MSGINEHIVHAENNKINEMKTTMNANINAYDTILQEIYNYNKYIDLSFSDNTGNQGNFNNNYGNVGNTLADLSGLLQQNSEYQKQLLKHLMRLYQENLMNIFHSKFGRQVLVLKQT